MQYPARLLWWLTTTIKTVIFLELMGATDGAGDSVIHSALEPSLPPADLPEPAGRGSGAFAL